MAAGHELKGIFFYSEGVTHANGLTVIPTDELDTAKGFKALNQQHNIPLLICVTAAEKRGILNQEQAQIESLAHHNLDPHYTSAGLAEMAALAGESDKVVQFK